MKRGHPIGLLLVVLISVCGVTRASYTLTVSATNGTVIKDPDAASYPAGTLVRLIPVPHAGYCFSSWSGDLVSKSLVGRVTVDGNKNITANFVSWTPPIGIPSPSFGIFETYRMYDTAANRNDSLTYTASDSGGFYTSYVDNTGEFGTAGDSDVPGNDHYYGSKTHPRLSVRRDLPAGSVVEVHHGADPAGSGYYFFTGQGTSAKPIFVRGVGLPNLPYELYVGYPERTCYLIVEGLQFPRGNVLSNSAAYQTTHISVRNCDCCGTQDTGGLGVAVYDGMAGCEQIVLYGNRVRDAGVWDPNLAEGDRDIGALFVDDTCHYIWAVDNELCRMESCGFIIVPYPQAIPNDTEVTPHHVYVGRNISHHNKQSGPWSKTSRDCVFSQNYSYGHYASTSSNGGGFGFQYDVLRLWFLFNTSESNNHGWDTGSGMGVSTRDEIYFIGNVAYNCAASGFHLNGLETPNPVVLLFNTIYGCPKGVYNGYYNVKASIQDNLFANYTSAIYFSSGYTSPALSGMDYNLLDGSGNIIWGSTYANLPAFQTGTVQGDHCIEADPLFVNASQANFHLQAASPAIDAGISSGLVQQVFDRFEQLYGINIRKDIEGRAKPQGSGWDFGAYEYVLSPIEDLAASGTSQNSVTLTWTVPGEPGITGVPTRYDIRYAGSSITEATWEAATQVPGEPVAGSSGETQSFTITGLSPGTTYYMAIKVLDEAGHASVLSNIVSGTTASTGNRAPSLQPVGDKSVIEEETLTFVVSAADADGNPLAYSTGTLPMGASFTAATGTFAWTPTNLQSGRYRVMFQVSDGQVTVSETITITVRAGIDQPPVLAAIGGKSTNENTLLSFALSATDPDGDPLSFSATGLPSGAGFAGGVFMWTPNYDQAGSYPVTFTVTDGELTDSEPITITVADVSDRTPPSAQAVYPAVDAIQVPLNSVIVLTISDAGSGIEASTVTIRVNNQLVYSGGDSLYESAYGICRRTGTRASYQYYYQPANAFDFDQQETVLVNASDAVNNAMTPLSYRFTTEMRSFGQNQPISSESDTSGRPALATDGQGNLWAAWHAGPVEAGDIYVAKRGSQLQQWNTPLRLASVASDRCNPALAVGPDDALYLAWQDNRRGNWDIYVSVSHDGSTWGDPIRVTDSNDTQVNPVIAVDQASPYHVYIAWERGNAGSRDIYLASCSSSFISKTIAQVTSDPADQAEPALAVGSDNTVYLLWTDQRNGLADIDIYGSSSAESSWSNRGIVRGPGNQSNPAVAAAPGTSVLHVAWQSDAAGNLDVLYGTSDGLPAGPLSGSSLIDDTTGADQFAPSIMAARDHANNVHVYACWQDNRVVGSTQDSDLYVAEIRSGAGGTNILVGDDETNSNQSDPALGCDEYGQPAIVWTDSRSSTPRIYGACSVYAKPVAVVSALITRTVGGRVGVDPAAINDVRDVSIQIPPTAYDCDVTVSIFEIQNLPRFTSLGIAGYETGPSGVQFAFPATVTIPCTSSGSSQRTPYCYDALTGTLSQQGMTDITYRTLANGIPVISFKTTHLSTFYVLESPVAAGGGGGGGCALSHEPRGNIAGFFFPYAGLVLLLLILRRRDRRYKGA